MMFDSVSDKKALEEGTTFSPTFDARGLIPAVATCAKHGGVLMQAWMNAEAIQKTLETGEVHYYSRSRKTLWHKGASSGEIQYVQKIRVDCDQDCLWLEVIQDGGGCCHVGYQSCFFREVSLSDEGQAVLKNTGHKK